MSICYPSCTILHPPLLEHHPGHMACRVIYSQTDCGVRYIPLCGGNSGSKEMDQPINNQILAVQDLFTYGAKPRRRLFHHLIPGFGVEALRMDAVLRFGRYFNPDVTQLEEVSAELEERQ